MLSLFNIFILLLATVFSVNLIVGPKLYVKTKNPNYFLSTYFTTAILIYLIYYMEKNKFSLIFVDIYVRIVPTVIVTLFSFFILKSSKFSLLKLLELILLIGIYLLLIV